MSITVLKCLSFVNSRKLPTNLSPAAFFLEHLHLIIPIHSASMRVPLSQHLHNWNLLCGLNFVGKFLLLTLPLFKPTMYLYLIYVKPTINKHFIFRYVQVKIFFVQRYGGKSSQLKMRIFAKVISKLRLDTLAWKSERTRAWFEARLNNNSMSPGVEKSFVIWEGCCFKAHLFFIRSPVYLCPVWSRHKKTHAKWDRWKLHRTLFTSHLCKCASYSVS